MIIVMEVWLLKPEMESRALEILQEMENLLGPAAHSHRGWCDHARFLQDADKPARLVLLYPWHNRELLDDLLASEEPKLSGFIERYCIQPRQIHCLRELPVDIDVELGQSIPAPGG